MNRFFGRKTMTGSNTQRALSRLMMTSALVAAGTFSISSSAMAADPWSNVTGFGFTNTSGGANVTNIVATTPNGKASGTGNLDILAGQTVNINAQLFVARDNRPTIQTSILGNLNSNGTVVLIDTNGVMFGKDSRIDVGSLIATTGNVDDNRIMGDSTTPFSFSNFGTGEIVNNGSIAASGLVAFVAPTVKNNGVINANLGRVSLTAGNTTATVDLYGDGLVEFAANSVVDSKSKFLSENTGSITGGKIQMTAAATKAVVDSVVNMQGVLTANSVSKNAKGEIVLSAGKVVLGSASTKSPSVKGNTKVTATQLDLGLTVEGDISGSAKLVNVLSPKAKIAQGLTVISENGTVNVAAGTYNEHLVIDKAGVTLNGANAGKSANGIRGAETIINPNSPGVEIMADNVTVDGLTFSNALNADGYGIFVNGGDNAYLANNIIKNTAQSGIYVLNANDTVISNNNIGATAAAGNIGTDGIHLLNTDGVSIVGNVIANTTSTGDEIGSGVYVENSTGAIVALNTIHDVKWDGVKVKGGSDSVVTLNTIYNAARAGVATSFTDATIIFANLIRNVSLWGVWSEKNTDLSIIGNNVKTAGAYGVFSDRDTDTLISGNIISDIKHDGIRVQNTSGDIWITENNIGATVSTKNIKGDGIHLTNTDGAFVYGNTIANTESLADEVGSGIYAQESDDVIITGNTIYKTGWDGVKVRAGDNFYVADNIIHDTGRSGVAVSESTNSTVENNKLYNLKIWGIWSTLNDGLDIVGNSINNVYQRHGIISYLDSDLLIDDNTINTTKRDGVHIVDSSDLYITNNKIGSTGTAGNIQGDGVNIYLSNDVTVAGNVIANTTSPADEIGSGVYALESDNISITDNLIYKTGWDGVKIKGGDNNYVGDNEIHDTGRAGVAVSETTGTTVEGNNLYNLKVWGVWSSLNDGLQILSNDITNVYQRHGVLSYLDNDITVDGNTIDTVRRDGVRIQEGTGAVYVTGNTISNTGDNGVYVGLYTPGSDEGEGEGEQIFARLAVGADGVYVNDNIITTTGDGGVFIENTTSPIIEVNGNTIEDTLDGVVFTNVNGNISVALNDISNSLFDGIYASSVNRDLDTFGEGAPDYQLTIADNTIVNTGFNGVELEEVGGVVTIDTNTITNTDGNGILAYNNAGPDQNFPSEGGLFGLLAIGYQNPIELHIVGNTILNDFGSEQGEGSFGTSGFAAVNLDIGSDGYAELSGNILGDNFEYGLVAYSGTIDLTGATNTIQNTDIGMGFYPSSSDPETDTSEYFDELASKLSLVGNTIGTTAFVDQLQYFVDLGYGAFFAPGTPTIIDGNNATYTLGGATIDPASNGGFVTDDELLALETYINHYNDAQNRGLFFFSVPSVASASRLIDQKDVIRDVFGVPIPDGAGGNLTITGLPSIGGPFAVTTPANTPFNPALIEPAAGDESGDPTGNDVANIQPAAGGGSETACWADASVSLGQGAPVTFNFGATGTAMLQNAVNCGSGQGAPSGQPL